MFKEYFRRIIENELEKRFPTKEPFCPPTGYNSLDVIRKGMFHWILVPFAGEQIWCKCRTLNRTQIEACGSFGVIDISNEKKNVSKEDIIEMRNSQEALIRATLIDPSFEELEKFIFEEDNIMSSKKKQIDNIEKEIEETEELNTAQRIELENKLYELRLFTSFVLPEDTFGFLTSWALGIDISDIKKISRKELYTAAVLAKNGNNNPSDHLSGVFTDRDKDELNKNAWIVYNEHHELDKIGKGKMRWIGGPMSDKR